MTSIYFSHHKEMVGAYLVRMLAKLNSYMHRRFKGKKGSALMGFSREKELYNIFRALFGETIFGSSGHEQSGSGDTEHIARRIMSELWNACQNFRQASSPADSANANLADRVQK